LVDEFPKATFCPLELLRRAVGVTLVLEHAFRQVVKEHYVVPEFVCWPAKIAPNMGEKWCPDAFHDAAQRRGWGGNAILNT